MSPTHIMNPLSFDIAQLRTMSAAGIQIPLILVTPVADTIYIRAKQGYVTATKRQ